MFTRAIMKAASGQRDISACLNSKGMSLPILVQRWSHFVYLCTSGACPFSNYGMKEDHKTQKQMTRNARWFPLRSICCCKEIKLGIKPWPFRPTCTFHSGRVIPFNATLEHLLAVVDFGDLPPNKARRHSPASIRGLKSLIVALNYLAEYNLIFTARFTVQIVSLL